MSFLESQMVSAKSYGDGAALGFSRTLVSRLTRESSSPSSAFPVAARRR